MSSFFEPATPVDGAREVRTPGTPVESPPEPAENSAMDSIYEFMSGLLGLGGAGGDGGRAAAARGEPLERSTTRMRDALLARNKSVKSGPRRQRRDTELLKIPLKSVYDVREKIGNGSYGTVCRCWHVGSGASCFRFNVGRAAADSSNSDAPLSKTTAVAFDTSGRRLLTGSQDGMVRLWNFSSGEPLRECLPPPEAYRDDASDEITSVMGIQEGPFAYIAAVGWSRQAGPGPRLLRPPPDLPPTSRDLA